MTKHLFSVLFALLLVGSVWAGDVLRLKPGHPSVYVVQKGDTLWDISGIFLQDPWLWPELWHYNRQIDNPHLIYPGDVLRLVWVDGKPRLIFDRGGDELKLKPHMRISDLTRAIPTIPLDAIAPFLHRNRIVTPEELRGAPYVLIGREGNLVSGAGDEVYGRGNFGDDRNFGIYRRGRSYVDPRTNEFLGLEAVDIGSAEVLSLEGEIAALALNRSTQEIRRSDRLLPLLDRRVEASYQPRPPEEPVNGEIVGVLGGLTQIGPFNAVVINRGEREGLTEGHVLRVLRAGELVRDPVNDDIVRVPDYPAGLLMIFRTFEKLSYGLVLQAELPLKVGDKLENP